jgi:hypothetical protein
MRPKLFLVEVQMSVCLTIKYNKCYVVAKNTDEAYQMVKSYLEGNDVGFAHDRELKSITLIADSAVNTHLPILFA